MSVPPTWSSSIGAVFTKTNIAPGDTFSGLLKLKRIGGSAANTTLRVRADMTGASSPSLAEAIEITNMTLGAGPNLAPLWPAACQPLTLTTLNSCPNSPFLAPPSTDPGDTFSLTMKMPISKGNAYQGKNAGSVTLVFTLNDTTPDGTGRFVARNNVPSPFAPPDFTMTVKDAGGNTLVSGPGNDKSANGVPVNQALTVSITGATTSRGTSIHLVNVTCVSTKRPGFTLTPTGPTGPGGIVTPAQYVTSLVLDQETLTCTFNWVKN